MALVGVYKPRVQKLGDLQLCQSWKAGEGSPCVVTVQAFFDFPCLTAQNCELNNPITQACTSNVLLIDLYAYCMTMTYRITIGS